MVIMATHNYSKQQLAYFYAQGNPLWLPKSSGNKYPPFKRWDMLEEVNFQYLHNSSFSMLVYMTLTFTKSKLSFRSL